MRTQLRLLAPFSILATALYLALWAVLHPATNPLPISVGAHQFHITTASKADHKPAVPINQSNSQLLTDTVEAIHP